MRRRLLLKNCLFAAVVLALSGITLAKGGPNASDFKDRLITVLNPAVGTKLADRVPLAPRLDTVEGKTIYVVDMNYEGFGHTAVFGEMQKWFAENMPSVKVIAKLKRGSYMSDDPELWKEIASNKGDGVILGVAG